MEQIPDIIKKYASENGFNAVRRIGVRDGAEAFSLGSVDENGEPLPTGLPTVLLLKGGKIVVKDGLEALRLL